MKKLILPAVAVAAVAATAPAMAQDSAKTSGSTGEKLLVMKSMTRAEVAQRVQQHFERLDSNRDGVITKAEAEAAHAAMRQRIQGRMQNRGSTLFDRLDGNKDGVVTREEAETVFAQRQVEIAHAGPGDAQPRRNWDALISRFDSNKDGSISRAEFDAVHASLGQKMATRGGKAAMLHAGFGGRMFEGADADKDGNITLEEATNAALARFDAADVNRDGVLTPEEMHGTRQRMEVIAPGS